MSATSTPDGEYEIDGKRYTVRTVLEGELKPGPGSGDLAAAAKTFLGANPPHCHICSACHSDYPCDPDCRICWPVPAGSTQ